MCMCVWWWWWWWKFTQWAHLVKITLIQYHRQFNVESALNECLARKAAETVRFILRYPSLQHKINNFTVFQLYISVDEMMWSAADSQWEDYSCIHLRVLSCCQIRGIFSHILYIYITAWQQDGRCFEQLCLWCTSWLLLGSVDCGIVSSIIAAGRYY